MAACAFRDSEDSTVPWRTGANELVAVSQEHVCAETMEGAGSSLPLLYG